MEIDRQEDNKWILPLVYQSQLSIISFNSDGWLWPIIKREGEARA